MTANKGFRFKAVCFAIEGASSFAVSLFFYYLYFLMRDQFRFGNKANLILAAALGLVCAVTAWQAGKFAQRCGYFTALKLGFIIMIVALAVGSQLHSATGLVIASAVMTVGMCFLWPTLEALVSEGETVAGLQRTIGIYNIVWSSTNVLGLFCGGTLVEKFGYKSIFYIPIVLCIGQLALTFWLAKHADSPREIGGIISRGKAARKTANEKSALPGQRLQAGGPPPPEPNRPSPRKAKAFLRMAWLANPFAYIAINTFTAMLPGVAAKFQLSPMLFGFTCSLWGFVRLGVFVALWQWTGWHYRFRWLVTAFLTLIISFAAILMSPNLAVLLLAQIIFGGATGLIYYSSLFYSMDVGDTKSEHGGIHEAAIGVGNLIGPAVGAAALQFLPQYTNSSAMAVSVLLVFGLGGLFAIQRTAK